MCLEFWQVIVGQLVNRLDGGERLKALYQRMMRPLGRVVALKRGQILLQLFDLLSDFFKVVADPGKLVRLLRRLG